MTPATLRGLLKKHHLNIFVQEHWINNGHPLCELVKTLSVGLTGYPTVKCIDQLRVAYVLIIGLVRIIERYLDLHVVVTYPTK